MSEDKSTLRHKGRKKLVFEPGDLIWLHLSKDRFPELRKSKLMPRADGPFKVLERINDNAYKLELPADFGVSPTFNIADLKPYLDEKDETTSRTTSIQEGEDDEDITTIDTTDTPTATHHLVPQLQGPLANGRAHQLNYQVPSLLGILPNIYENMMLPKSNVFMLFRRRNMCGDDGKPARILDGAASEDFRTLKPP